MIHGYSTPWSNEALYNAGVKVEDGLKNRMEIERAVPHDLDLLLVEYALENVECTVIVHVGCV